MSKKYKLTDETLEHDGRTLHRIAALKDFGNVHKGDKGGWVEKEENLSQKGKCWVYGEAKVYDDAQVYDDAEVYYKAQVYGQVEVCGKAKVYDDARVYEFAQVYDRAEVHGNARVYGDAFVGGNAEVYEGAKVHGEADVDYKAQVYGKAQVSDKAQVHGKAKVFGHAVVCDEALVFDEAQVYGEAIVGSHAEVCALAHVKANAILRTGTTKSEEDYVVVGPLGRRFSFATYHIPSDTVGTYCFKGTLEEFEAAVEEEYASNAKCLLQYKRVIRFFNLAKADLKGARLDNNNH